MVIFTDGDAALSDRTVRSLKGCRLPEALGKAEGVKCAKQGSVTRNVVHQTGAVCWILSPAETANSRNDR